MKWKVCGMKYPDNIKEVLSLKPDFMGFIFYKRSARYVGDHWKGVNEYFPRSTQKAGVFVNEDVQVVKKLAKKHQLDLIQLHGDETPAYCERLAGDGFHLIKAAAISGPADFSNLDQYKPWVKFFLFDTSSDQYGGTGRTFDWSTLHYYDHQLPFFLSGGISLENLHKVAALDHSDIAAIDVNSKFEDKPGMKNLSKLKSLKDQLPRL